MPTSAPLNDQTPLLRDQLPVTPFVQTPLLVNSSSAVVNIRQSLDDESYLQILKKLGAQSWALVLRGGVVAVRYTLCSILLSKINEGLLAPNTLVNALESVLVIFAGRSLSIESSEISTLTGKINKEKQYIAEFQDGIAILSRDGVTDAIRKMLTNIEKHAQEIGIEFVQSPAADTQKESIEVLLQNCIQKAEEKIDQHNKQIGIVLRHGMLLGLLLSLPITGLYYFANHHVLQLVGQHPFVVEKSKEYFQAAALGFVPLTLLTAQQRLLQGLHQPFPVLISNTLHTALCAAFSYLFLFGGKLGFPKLEMDGVGYAFAIAGWATLFANTFYYFMKKDLAPYKVFSLEGGFQWPVLKDLGKKGIPSGLQFTTENIANMINSVFLGWHNLEALSADQMAMQIALFSSIGSGGLAQAISVCVGKALGEKKYGALKKYGNVGIVLGTAFPALAFFVLLAVREQFISLYVNTKNPDNAELVRLASSFLLLECLRQLMTAVQFTASGALLGFKDTSFTFKTSLGLSLGLNAALLSLMHFALHMNSLALFSEKAIGVGMAAFLNAFRWVLKSHEQSRQEKEAIKDQSLPYRVSRALTLFCSGSPKEKEERRPENDLAGPLVINAS